MRKIYNKKYKKYCKQLGITLDEGKETPQEILIDWENHICICTYLNLYDVPYVVVYNNEKPEKATKCCRLSLVSNEYINIFTKTKMVLWILNKQESIIISKILRKYWTDIIFKFSAMYIDIYGSCKNIPLHCPYIDGIINIVENNHQMKGDLVISDINKSNFLSIISIG